MKNYYFNFMNHKLTLSRVKRGFYKLLAICLMTTLSTYVQAQITAEFKYRDTIKIDGDLKDWSGITAINIDTIGKGTFGGDADHNATFKAVWDANNIYMVFEITDDSVVNNGKAKAFERDGIEVAFNLSGNSTFNLTNALDDIDEGKVAVVYGDTKDSTLKGSDRKMDNFFPGANYEVITKKTTTGYLIEIKIPFKDIYKDFDTRNGRRFNMGIRVIDSDGATNSTVSDGRVCWGGKKNINKDASDFNFVTLNGRTELPKDFTINYKSDIKIDGAFSDWSSIVAQPIDIFKDGIINNDKDFSAQMKLAWDTSKVYILVNVVDDSLANPKEAAVHTRDAIEIAFNLKNNSVYNLTDALNDDDEGKILIVYGDTRDSIVSGSGRRMDMFVPSKGFDLKMADSDSGYTVELAIPFKDIYGGFKADNDTIFEMGINLADNDGVAREARITYGGKTNLNKTITDFVNIKLAGLVKVFPVQSVSISNCPSSPLKVNETITLTAVIAPSNATNKNLTWSSSNSSVATVTSAGVVTAVAIGTATITVTTQDGSFTNTCSISVQPGTFINDILSSQVAVYPLPVANGQLNVAIKESLSNDFTIEITSISGQKVVSKAYSAIESSAPIIVSLPENISKGWYVVTICSNDTKISQTILVK